MTEQDQPPVTMRAALVRWARFNWKTSSGGFLAGTIVLLQRVPERIRWHDVAVALFVLLLGLLGKDPDKLLDARGP